MKSKGFEGMVCSIAGVLDAVGDRWAWLIVRDLSLGLCRFEELRRSTGITNTTLSDRLKHLEAKGLVDRTPDRERPDRPTYRLTKKGYDLEIVLRTLSQVGDKWGVAADRAPMTFFDRSTGRPVEIATVEKSSKALVSARDVRPRAGAGADDLVRWRLSKLRG